MKFDENVIDVLKNFATLNPSIVVKEGNKLETISTSKAILAEAMVPIVFERRFAIYNLPRFIQTISLFKDPDFTFENKYVKISEGNKSVNYMYAEERTMEKYKVPENKPVMGNPDIEFDITSQNLKDMEKAISILGVPNFIFEGDGTNILLKADNVQNPTSDNYSLVVGQTDKVFRGIFDASSLKMMKDDYKIHISNTGISRFIGNKVSYFVVFDYKSKF